MLNVFNFKIKMLILRFLYLYISSNVFFAIAERSLREGTNEKFFKKCIFLNSEKDIYYHDEIPQTITSKKLTGARYMFISAPLKDFYNQTKVVGIFTSREFTSLRDSYNIRDYVTTFHFFDSKFPGGSSLTRILPYISVSDGIFIYVVDFDLSF